MSSFNTRFPWDTLRLNWYQISPFLEVYWSYLFIYLPIYTIQYSKSYELKRISRITVLIPYLTHTSEAPTSTRTNNGVLKETGSIDLGKKKYTNPLIYDLSAKHVRRDPVSCVYIFENLHENLERQMYIRWSRQTRGETVILFSSPQHTRTSTMWTPHASVPTKKAVSIGGIDQKRW